MKRRLKFTPFAKIVFVVLIIAAARYVYLHQDEITEGRIFNFKDTLAANDSIKETENISDTVVFYIYENDSLIRFKFKKKEFNIHKGKNNILKDSFILDILNQNYLKVIFSKTEE